MNKSPYVCNNCPRYTNNHCTYHYLEYKGSNAHEKYLKLKSISNKIQENIDLIKEINKALVKGQLISHIYLTLLEKYKNNIISKFTIYNWINKGILIYQKKKIKRKQNVIIEKVQYKQREQFLKGKEYMDYLKYISENNIKNIVEIDLVCGEQGTRGHILTMFMPRLQFLMAYKLNNKTPQEVVRVFDEIEAKIGYSTFKKLFGCLLTDRGSEFLKVNEICYSKEKLRKRTKIFYCDAGSPTQKSNIENIHLILRRVYPKGKSLEKVIQEDLYEVVSNINSLKKKKYEGKTLNEMFIEHYSLTLLKKLSLRVYASSEVVLLPYTHF